MAKSKEPIRLRRRVTPSGNISLYLDIYVHGRRSYEYLHLYLSPSNSREAREKNRDTLLLAEAIRAKRVVALRNGLYGFRDDSLADTSFLDYYRSLCGQRSEGEGNHGVWLSCLRHLETYCKTDLKMSDLTPDFFAGFRDYLDKARALNRFGPPTSATKRLGQNTKNAYWATLNTCMRQAVRDNIIRDDPMNGVAGFGHRETVRVALTLDEVRTLAATPCKDALLERAFLFSCLTGLRCSDIAKMRWSEVSEQDGFTRFTFRQKKTGGQEYLDISPEAVAYMGERRNPESLVFDDFKYNGYTSYKLRAWAAARPISYYLQQSFVHILLL